MTTNLSGFDDFIEHFIPELREAMDQLAHDGEAYVKGAHGNMSLSFGGSHSKWNNDTGSLLASVTGYEITIGDPYANYSDSDWQNAQQFGSFKYNNPPEHYAPQTGGSMDTDDPTAVLGTFVGYPQEGKGNDIALGEAVDAALVEAMDWMGDNALQVIQSHMRYGTDSSLTLI